MNMEILSNVVCVCVCVQFLWLMRIIKFLLCKSSVSFVKLIILVFVATKNVTDFKFQEVHFIHSVCKNTSDDFVS